MRVLAFVLIMLTTPSIAENYIPCEMGYGGGVPLFSMSKAGFDTKTKPGRLCVSVAPDDWVLATYCEVQPFYNQSSKTCNLKNCFYGAKFVDFSDTTTGGQRKICVTYQQPGGAAVPVGGKLHVLSYRP